MKPLKPAVMWALGLGGVAVLGVVGYVVTRKKSTEKNALGTQEAEPAGFWSSLIERLPDLESIEVTETVLAGQQRGVEDMKAGLPAMIPPNYAGNKEFEVGYIAGFTGKPFGQGTL